LLYFHDREILVSLVKSRYRSEEKLQRYIQYIDTLVGKDLPPILTFRHLADYLGIEPRLLFKMAFNTDQFYTRFRIPKHNGGSREISAPYDSLDAIQRWIGEYVLKKNDLPFHSAVTGYVTGKSILDHVSPHVNSPCLIKLDIKNFFPSISVNFVRNIFCDRGYNNAVSRTLAALLTVNGALPQGASTSPYISNVRMRKLDDEIYKICESYKLIYTRYADDIIISGSDIIARLATNFVNCFTANGFEVNDEKTQLYRSPSEVRFITGLTINQGIIRLPKKVRRRIRVQAHLFVRDLPAMIAGAKTSALDFSQLKNADRKSIVYDPIFAERILGKLNYWLNIEPSNQYALRMKNVIGNKLAEL
jgi:RNA-directed DNA polymerase